MHHQFPGTSIFFSPNFALDSRTVCRHFDVILCHLHNVTRRHTSSHSAGFRAPAETASAAWAAWAMGLAVPGPHSATFAHAHDVSRSFTRSCEVEGKLSASRCNRQMKHSEAALICVSTCLICALRPAAHSCRMFLSSPRRLRKPVLFGVCFSSL